MLFLSENLWPYMSCLLQHYYVNSVGNGHPRCLGAVFARSVVHLKAFSLKELLFRASLGSPSCFFTTFSQENQELLDEPGAAHNTLVELGCESSN